MFVHNRCETYSGITIDAARLRLARKEHSSRVREKSFSSLSFLLWFRERSTESASRILRVLTFKLLIS